MESRVEELAPDLTVEAGDGAEERQAPEHPQNPRAAATLQPLSLNTKYMHQGKKLLMDLLQVKKKVWFIGGFDRTNYAGVKFF